MFKALTALFSPRITPAQRQAAIEYWVEVRKTLNLKGAQLPPEEKFKKDLADALSFANRRASLTIDSHMRYYMVFRSVQDAQTNQRSMTVTIANGPSGVMTINNTGGIVVARTKDGDSYQYEKIFQDPNVEHLPYLTQKELEGFPVVMGTIRHIKSGQQNFDLATLASVDPTIDKIDQNTKPLESSVLYHHNRNFAGHEFNHATGLNVEVYGYARKDDYRQIVKVIERTGSYYRAEKTGLILDGTTKIEKDDLLIVKDQEIQPVSKPYRFIKAGTYVRLNADSTIFEPTGLK